MRLVVFSPLRSVIGVAVCVACSHQSRAAPSRIADRAFPAAETGPGGLILQIGEGERRVRRFPGAAPFIIKGDRGNGGSAEHARATSVREGEPVTPLSAEERAEIRRRMSTHVVFDEP